MTARLKKIEEHLKMAASEADIHLCKSTPSPRLKWAPRTVINFSLEDTTGTPNGIKVSILLEELGLPYQVSAAEALAHA